MIRCGSVNFRARLVISDQKVKPQTRTELRFAVLLRDLDVGAPEAPETAPPLPAEKGHQDVVLLPVEKREGFAGPLPLRVSKESLEESDNPIRRILIKPASA